MAIGNLARGLCSVLACATAVLAPGVAGAKVTEVSDRGFVVRHLAEVPASVEETWALLIKPSAWWDSAHTWSGSAANMTLDARPGGCFCEVLPATDSAKGPPRGGVEHMRVIYVERPRALRMSGLLGPLQADAANGVMTIQLKAAEGKTQVLLEYAVGGFLRNPADKMAPAVDGVLAGQLSRLAGKLGGAFEAAFSAPGQAPAAAPEGEGAAPAAPAELPPPPEPAKPGEITGR